MDEIVAKFSKLSKDIGILSYTGVYYPTKESLYNFPFIEAKLSYEQLHKLEISMNRNFEFFSIIRSEIAKKFKFYDKVNGLEYIFWSLISKNYYRYVVDKPLAVYHAEGVDRLTVKKDYTDEELLEWGKAYLRLLEIIGVDLKNWNPKKYGLMLSTAGLYLYLGGDGRRGRALLYESNLYYLNPKAFLLSFMVTLVDSKKFRKFYDIYFKYKSYLRFRISAMRG